MVPDDNPQDDDFDGNPGNSLESERYAQTYRTAEKEWSNELEPANELEMKRLLEDAKTRAKLDAELEEAESRIQFWPNVGKFIIPAEYTYAAHQQLVRSTKGADLHFNPDKYPYFDAIIVKKANRPDMFDPSHPKYDDYAQAREELAVVRNAVIGYFDEDPDSNHGDEKYVPKLVGMGESVGNALNNNGWLTPLFSKSLSSNLINIEGEGAAYIYQHLYNDQRSPTFLSGIRRAARRMIGLRAKEWELPPIEETSFSAEGLNAPPPPDLLCMTKEQYASCCARRYKAWEQATKKNPEKYGHLESPVTPDSWWQPVAHVKDDEKRESVEHGRIILRWLRNLKFSDKSAAEFVDAGTPQEKADNIEQIAQALNAFDETIERLKKDKPEALQDATIKDGQEVADHFRHMINLMASKEIPISVAATQQISAADQAHDVGKFKDKTVDSLVERMEAAEDKAIDTLAQQQAQDQQESLEMADAIMDAMVLTDSQKRKRKRKGGVSATSSAAKQKKLQRDITSDDRVLGQGIYAAVNEQKARQEIKADRQRETTPSISVRDLAAVQEIRNSLMQSNGQAKDAAVSADARSALTALAVAEASLNERLLPDNNQTNVAREVEKRNRPNTPRNQRNNGQMTT